MSARKEWECSYYTLLLILGRGLRTTFRSLPHGISNYLIIHIIFYIFNMRGIKSTIRNVFIGLIAALCLAGPPLFRHDVHASLLLPMALAAEGMWQSLSYRSHARTKSTPSNKRETMAAFLPSMSNRKNEEECIWYEIPPPLTQYDLDSSWQSSDKQGGKLPRKILWYGRYDNDQTWVPRQKKAESTMATNAVAHPLRHRTWNLHVQWTGKYDRQLPSTIRLEFDIDTGYCLARNFQNHDDVVGLGQWETFPWGVWFTLIDASGSVEYTCTAQLHLNPFGDHAKLMQGSIVRYCLTEGVEDAVQDSFYIQRNRPWFRPVVGRFSGQGR